MLKVDPKKTISYRPDDRGSKSELLISIVVSVLAIALLIVPVLIFGNYQRQTYVTQCVALGRTEAQCLLRWRELRIAGGSS